MGFLYFYDWINTDARRQTKPDFYAYTGISESLATEIASNTVEVEFTRMLADYLYTDKCKRNYKIITN
jgi:hypothetical protein